MVVTWTGWALVPVAMLAVVAIFWPVLILLRGRDSGRTVAEALLAATVVTVLTIYGEVRLLSLVPVTRPLDWLPWVHAVGAVAFVLGVRRWRREDWRAAPAELRRTAVSWLRAIGIPMTVGMAVTLVMLGAYFVFGMRWITPQWDEWDYHVPMAVQPWQDGVFAPLPHFIPTAWLFPRGAETLWYFTLRLTGTDLLFHSVQLAFGIQLLLGVYVLARRTGAAPREAALAAVALATTPIFYMLATTGYIDMGHASSTVAVIAFLAPRGQRGGPVSADWHLALLALAQACIIKYPVIAVIFAVPALLQNLLRAPLGRALLDGLRFVFSPRGLGALAVLAACAETYIDHARQFGNPLYPYEIAIAGQKLLPGDYRMNTTNNGGQTSLSKPISEMDLLERYDAAWTDFRAPLTIESFGSFGPVLPYALLLMAGAFALAALITRNTWRIALVLAAVVVLVLTPAAVPRYGLPVVTVIFVCGACAMSEAPRSLSTGLVVVTLLLCFSGVQTSWKSMLWWGKWFTSNGGDSLTRRNVSHFDKVDIGGSIPCSPAMTEYIRSHCGPGETLAWNVRTFAGLLLNYTWSNRLVHLPGTAGEIWPTLPGSPQHFPEPSAEELTQWLARLRGTAARYVLVYRESAYARHLLTHPDFGYTVAFEEPPSKGKHVIVLFERASAPATSAPTSAPAATMPGTND